jgi:hypothetical protein
MNLKLGWIIAFLTQHRMDLAKVILKRLDGHISLSDKQLEKLPYSKTMKPRDSIY